MKKFIKEVFIETIATLIAYKILHRKKTYTHDEILKHFKIKEKDLENIKVEID